MLLPKTQTGMSMAFHLDIINESTVCWASNGISACIEPYPCVIRRHRDNGLFKVHPVDAGGNIEKDSARDINIRDVCTDEAECRVLYRRALAERHERLQRTLADIQNALRELDDDRVPCQRAQDPMEIRIDAAQKVLRRDMAPAKKTVENWQARIDDDIDELADMLRLPRQDIVDMIENDAATYRAAKAAGKII